MTTRGWILIASLSIASIGCASTSEGSQTEAPAEPVAAGTDDLREASPEDETSPAATARGRDAIVDQARADKLVGEEASGYLGLVTDGALIAGKSGPGDLEARVQNINLQRRAIYTDLATKNGATVEDVAHTTACVLLRDKVKVGEAYRTESTEWKVRVFDVPVTTPSFCAPE